MDSFEPKTAFEGYVSAKLQSIEKQLDDLAQGHATLSSRVTKIEIKGGIAGAISGAVSAVLTSLGLKQL